MAETVRADVHAMAGDVHEPFSRAPVAGPLGEPDGSAGRPRRWYEANVSGCINAPRWLHCSVRAFPTRGPIALRELTTYKFVIEGSGQVRE